jgi:hypothetical protein
VKRGFQSHMDNNLHSLNKLKNNIKATKLLSFLLPKDIQKKIKKLNIQLVEMENTIIRFNDYFADLGWCAYDSMNMSLMKEAIKVYESSGTDAGERVLLKYYQDNVKEQIPWLKNESEPFAQRYTLIQRAFDDHFAGRYYASVPLFLIIIDGAVNDYTKSKGFFAEGTDVTAWDCLVGCSNGLTKMKDIFNKGRNKTTREEIRLPYRNGILHGRDLNYGNEYVSCKCVVLMFALADWMNLKDNEEKRKAKFEKASNPPPLHESLKKLRENALKKDEMSKWQRREVIVGIDIPFVPTIEDCAKYQYVVPLIKAFNAWKAKNYGALSVYFNRLFSYETSEKKRAGECRRMFSSKNFCSFKLKEIEERACSMTRILVQADWEINGKYFSEPLEFGCLYVDENEKPVLPWRGNGRWTLVPWDVQGLYKV